MITLELVSRTLNTLGAGLAVAMFVWLALRWLKPLNSGARFAVWFSTLLVIAGLPFLTGSASSGTLAGGQHAGLSLPSFLAEYLFIAWAVIASLLVARLAVSLWHIRQLRINSSEVDVTSLDPPMRDIFAGTSRRVQLRVSDRMRVPAALGFFRPAIVIPSWALNELPVEELRVIVLHELAHLRRWDDWTNLAQKIVKALFFFHPAVWWIEGRLTLEREMACDDLVLAHTSNAKAYARSLLSLAERVRLGKGIALAQAALGRARETSLRITQILDANRPKATRVWKPALSLVTAMTAATILAVPYAPNLVVFEDHRLVASSAAFANVVPAKATFASALVPEAHVVPVKQMTASPAQPSTVIPSRTKMVDRNPMVMPANAKLDRIPVQQMLVVMESVQYDQSGSAVWTLCVWQITEHNSRQQQIRPEVVVNSL